MRGGGGAVYELSSSGSFLLPFHSFNIVGGSLCFVHFCSKIACNIILLVVKSSITFESGASRAWNTVQLYLYEK